MKLLSWTPIALATLCAVSCNNHPIDDVVSQQFVHKYGFHVSEQEWEQRAQEGQVVTLLKNGVKITHSYENGLLHGPTTHTFPHSDVVEKLLVYDEAALLKECLYDSSGMPIQEEVYELDDRTILTLWDEKGVPLSVEQFDGELLVEGAYYTPEHQLEGEVIEGIGDRIRRDRTGLLLSHDRIENGVMASRTTYHANGQVHTVSHYHDHQLHGEQLKYSSQGKPLMILNWSHGVLNGPKTVFRSGYKVAEIPYLDGQKHGLEIHYDDLGNLTAEIEWRNDKKHGAKKLYSEEGTEVEWFHKGQLVSAEKFEILENREQLIAEFNGTETR
jgi:antitoxin component YwqK of YwqJK toxin-antitoxin module